ncbi:ead/Ea22-like family protein [Salmonella enterica]|nr:ead/Ea22-like family protein [Salmonella enterica subsp. enterica serovar Sandiego]EJJ3987855.1 ead/Ea22-like family protein [Salmonella enterica]EJJ4374267.1 ead/Ea22-like family protein [Salmonella enterica]EJJ4474020.1 ead/Ea22-like family protein [Salmonella enterica]EJJ4490741.1 ead/Ea22-like family protein [Salmonella enterica]
MTIDKQALRARAEKATCGEWSLEYGESRFDDDDALIHREVAGCIPICRIEGAHPESGFDEDFQMEQQANAEFISAANPAAVLALLDENLQLQREKDAIEAVALALRDDMRQAREQLEAGWKQNATDVQIKARLCRESNSLHDRLREAEKRIAELEAREVMLPDRKSEIFWPGDAAEFDILGYVIAVKSAIRAAGIKVKEE